MKEGLRTVSIKTPAKHEKTKHCSKEKALENITCLVEPFSSG